ncbi:MAG: aspartate/glutamate racemase family protein, partial [Acidobacteriota bacterium]
MRILYVIPGPMSRHQGRRELDRRRRFLQERAAPGTEVAVWDVGEGPASIESTVEEYLAVPPLLEAVARANTAGYDALVVGCFGDPGVEAAREIASIPIIGPCEASLLASIPLGHRTSIITVLESVVHPLRRVARVVGLEGRLASVRSIDVAVLDLSRDRARALAAFVDQGRRALQED